MPELVDVIAAPVEDDESHILSASIEKGKIEIPNNSCDTTSTLQDETNKYKSKFSHKKRNLNQICLVMDLMETDLNRILRSETNIDEAQLTRIVYNSLCALAFMHEANVIHRDLKPANILVNSDCSVKIIDFGMSRTVPENIMDYDGYNSMYIRK